MCLHIFKPISKHELTWLYVTDSILNIKYNDNVFYSCLSSIYFLLFLKRVPRFCPATTFPHTHLKVLLGLTPSSGFSFAQLTEAWSMRTPPGQWELFNCSILDQVKQRQGASAPELLLELLVRKRVKRTFTRGKPCLLKWWDWSLQLLAPYSHYLERAWLRMRLTYRETLNIKAIIIGPWSKIFLDATNQFSCAIVRLHLYY